MNIESIHKVITILNVIAPEYKDVKEEEWKVWIELSDPYVSESKYGSLYYQAIAYLTAHKIALNALSAEGEQEKSIKNTMHVASYAAGSTNISFNNPAASGTTDANAEYLLTAYGMQFLSIKKKCVISIAISGMKGS